MNQMTFTGHRNHFPTTTTTTTTTRSYGPTPGQCNGCNAYNPAQNNSGIQLSSKAQMLMRFMGMMGQLMGGPFGELMSGLGVGGPGAQNQGQMQPFSNNHPGFGQPRNGMSPGNNLQQALNRATRPGNYNPAPRRGAFNAMNSLLGPRPGSLSRVAKRATASMNANAPQAPRGKATEMKAGQTMKAPNGSLVSWGKNGNVGIKYKDPNGQMRTVDVKDGMLRMDGGKPMKLENVGQLLKLPNGDVIGLGNNPQGPKGKQLCRVVMADNADQIKTDPASATNIYDIKNMQHTQTSVVPTRYDLNFNSSSYNGYNGNYQSNNLSASVTTGTPITTSHTYQELLYNSVK
jgi:hypothetical protein